MTREIRPADVVELRPRPHPGEAEPPQAPDDRPRCDLVDAGCHTAITYLRFGAPALPDPLTDEHGGGAVS